ncbi:MAG: ABC transporter ATP-binding protein [Pseudomonadota bacterium]
MTEAIIAKGLVRRYGDISVVDGVDLELEPGTVTALLGPSGAGKSTLLRLIAGLETSDAGSVQRGDAVLSGPGQMIPAERRRIGLIFQDFALFPHLSALENVRFGLSDIARAEGDALAADWLVRVGLADRLQSYPHQLSGGEQQRVAIARALAPQPVAILMDEPFSGLDPSLRQDVREAAMGAIRGVGIPALIVSHDAVEAMMVADKIAIMHNGKIIQAGSPEALYTAPTSALAAAALGPVSETHGKLNGRGLVETPFGALSPPTTSSSNVYRIIVRPEAVEISDANGTSATLRSVRSLGHVYQFVVEADGTRITGWAGHPVTATPGDAVSVRLDETGCFVFPAE